MYICIICISYYIIHITLTKTCVSVSIALECGSIEKFKDNVK